jgi:hypothetical protein
VVDTACQDIRERVVEVAGDLSRLDDAERQHLATCADCAELAAEERGLGQILLEAVPAAAPGFTAQVMARVAVTRRRQRTLALLPVAASLLVMAAGALLVGGLPGLGLVAVLPAWSAQGWLALFSVVTDIGVVLTTAASAAAAALPTAAGIAAAAVALVGGGAVVAATRRWREAYRWRRHD